jgi:hypothetical protein
MEIMNLALFASLALWGLQLRRRVDEVEDRIGAITEETVSRSRLRELELRIWSLENPATRPHPASDPVEAEAVAQETATPEPEPVRPLMLAETTEPEDLTAPIDFLWKESETPSRISVSEKLRRLLGDEEWETLVGGSILNKIGAVVLVIGIALFVAYSFAHVTAAGRAAIGFAVSAIPLLAGVRIERRARYRVFSRGLIGAGWAGLYATAYASYAIPAARIIENPFAGSVGLLLVAAGMIAHSLRYRSQSLTACAYVAAFTALAVTPSSPFAVVSLVPIAVSLLYLAAHFNWYKMALFGLVATWLTCVARAGSGAPLIATQALFLTYWVLFEAFDLLRVKRRVAEIETDLLYSVNLAAFLGLSYSLWSREAPERLWLAAAFASLLFLADALIRIKLCSSASFAGEIELGTRLRAGSYEGSLIVSALLAGLAIVGRVPGVWSAAALAMEAELLYLAGVRFDSQFLRGIGITGFAASLSRTVISDAGGRTLLAGHEIRNISPPVLFHAAIFWVNRAIRRQNIWFSSLAALLIAVVIALEAPGPFVGAGWAILGAALLQIGLWLRASEFRVQSYVLFAAACANSAMSKDWRALLISAIAVYFCAIQTRRTDASERDYAGVGASGACAMLAALLLLRVAPAGYTGAAESALAVLVLLAGLTGLPSQMRFCYGPVAALSIFAAVSEHAVDFARFPAASVWTDFVVLALAGWMATALWSWRFRSHQADSETRFMRHASAGFGALATMAALWMVTPDPALTILWSLLALVLLETGFRGQALGVVGIAWIGQVDPQTFDSRVPAMPAIIAATYWFWHRLGRAGTLPAILSSAAAGGALLFVLQEAGSQDAAVGFLVCALVLLVAGIKVRARDLRYQSYAVSSFAMLWTVVHDVEPAHLLVSGITAAGLYIAQIISRRAEERYAPALYSGLATFLTAAILWGKVSGGLLTTGWAVAALVLLAAGFAVRDRISRIEGLALLLVCILKAFLYDLRNLETVYRILSFIALGLILLAVSWIYTRFREHIRRLF